MKSPADLCLTLLPPVDDAFALHLYPPQLENAIQKSVKQEVADAHPHVVHNQTAAMLAIGTNLLTQTAEQSRKLSVVEAKVSPAPPTPGPGGPL